MIEVIIVGSGPAGMSAAFFLSLNERFKVKVLERLSDKQYDRYHSICGGGISKRAFRELRPMLPSGVVNEFSVTRLVWPDGTEVKMKTPGYILDRPTFLSNIRKECIQRGVEFVNCSVTDVEYDGRYTLRTTSSLSFSSDWLIGADGCCSVVRKKLFGSSPKERIPATECIVEEKRNDDLEITLVPDGSGTYTWSFPRGENTCTGGKKGYYEECGSIGSRFIPIGGVGDIVKGRALLIGDAAAMPNPISFGGLKAALISGKIASKAVVSDRPELLQKWWDSSILSNRRFMDFRNKLKTFSAEDMNDAVRPFRHGGIYLPGVWSCITRPKNIDMYVGTLLVFRHGW